MSKFNCSYKLVIKYTSTHSTSNAWIALHRCVEALARTKGVSFNHIFEVLETTFLFERKHKHNFPNADTIKKSAKYLKLERNIFLEKVNAEIKIRIIEKELGKRTSSNQTFLAICQQQNNYKQPRVGYWGWEKLRQEK